MVEGRRMTTLVRMLEYFSDFVDDECQVVAFNMAAERYLKVIKSRPHSDNQREYVAIRVCINVYRELAGMPPETPWCRSMEIKVETLPKKLRDAVRLYFEGMNSEEIATRLAVDPTIANRRCRAALRALYV